MSNGSSPGLRTFAFGDLQTGIWGATLAADDGVAAVTCSLDPGPLLAVAPVRLDGAGREADWELTGTALQLHVTPHGPAPTDPPGVEFVQLCQVSGRIGADGADREIDCLGVRSYAPDVDLRSLDSVRQVLTWFAPDDGIALSTRRPRGAKGHDRDVVTAIVVEPDGPISVSEGRLSTTYTESGAPARVGLELWLTEEENQFPRRVAGEALGVGADGTGTSDAVVGLHAFRCHSRGRDGLGAYLVAKPR